MERGIATEGNVTQVTTRWIVLIDGCARWFIGLKGHRIRLEITSSDFPNHDRNHNTGKNDLVDVELVAATQTVYHNAEQPSRLILKVDSGSD